MKNSVDVMPALPISAVERDTGLPKDTLRVWERRYGFPVPLRDAFGERLYPPEQVAKLRLIKRLLDQGWRPGKLMSTPTRDLAALLEQHSDSREAPSPPAESQTLLPLIRQHRAEALRAILGQLLMKQGLQRFVLNIVAPLNVEIGEAWMRGEIEVHEEHLYTEQVQNVLRSAMSAQGTGARRPRVMLTTLPEEQHGLGLLMAEALLVAENAQCASLGMRTPLTDIRLAAVASAADVVALSFSAAYPVRQAVSALNTLRAALPATIAIWAGGSAVRDKARQLPGVRVIGDIGDVLEALREWRSARSGESSREAET